MAAATVAAVGRANLTGNWSKTTFLATFTAIWSLELISWLLYALFLWPKLFSPLIGLPEPTDNHWLYGQQPRISKETTGVPMLEWMNSIPNDGLIRYLGIGNQERLLVTSAKALSEVMVTKTYDFPKPKRLQETLGRILGVGVLFAEGDEHKHQRKTLSPAFAFRHIKDLYPVFWRKANEGVDAMCEQIRLDSHSIPLPAEKDAPTQSTDRPVAVVEVLSWASRTTLDIIGVAGLGRDFRAIKDPNNYLASTYQTLSRPSKQAQLLALLGTFISPAIVNRLPVKRNGDVAASAAIIRETCRDLIREKKHKLATTGKATGKDILSVALESGEFGEDNLVDQLMTFLAAGHETTASAMTWAIYLLCIHQDVQDRLRAEIRAHVSPSDDDVTASAVVDQLPYLKAVCNEVLRYYSPVALTLRQSAVDTSIVGVAVPKGTRIMLVPSAVNKSRELWGSDAEKFNPERWLSRTDGSFLPSGGATSNFAMMTFLHGPRSCIGMNFAKAEFACLLAAWVRKVSFELRNKEEMDESRMIIKASVTQRPANGMWVYARVLAEETGEGSEKLER